MRRWASVLCTLWILSFSTIHSSPPEPVLEEALASFSAKVIASSVFISGREVDDAVDNTLHPLLKILGGLTPDDLTRLDVDRQERTVTVAIRQGPPGKSKCFADQGCVILPADSDQVAFQPVEVESGLPDPMSQAWPMGDVVPEGQTSGPAEAGKLQAALNEIFRPENHTTAFLVVRNGKILAERYGEGANQNTKLESWSMGKSLTAILYGVLTQQEGTFDPTRPAPIPEWQEEGDPRAGIRIADLMRMSSGLKFSSLEDPVSEWEHALPDHFFIYSTNMDVFKFAATRPAQFPPNTVGRYRNCDPLLIGYLIRRRVEARGESYLTFPQRHLFDKLGIRDFVLETDIHGNFVMTGFEYGRARDWARLGMLVLQDGVWQGERLLPDGFVEFVSSPAPAWEKPQYGGLFWLNRDGTFGLPADAFAMVGQGGQFVIIVPSEDLVVVRMGHQSGMGTATPSLNRALSLVLEALQPVEVARAEQPSAR